MKKTVRIRLSSSKLLKQGLSNVIKIKFNFFTFALHQGNVTRPQSIKKVFQSENHLTYKITQDTYESLLLMLTTNVHIFLITSSDEVSNK